MCLEILGVYEEIIKVHQQDLRSFAMRWEEGEEEPVHAAAVQAPPFYPRSQPHSTQDPTPSQTTPELRQVLQAITGLTTQVTELVGEMGEQRRRLERLERRPRGRDCYGCGKPGHIRKDCPQERKGRQGNE